MRCPGHLAQRLADGFTVVFNWPAVLQGAEERACALAIAIVAGAQKVSQSSALIRGGEALVVHVGMHAAVCPGTVLAMLEIYLTLMISHTIIPSKPI